MYKYLVKKITDPNTGEAKWYAQAAASTPVEVEEIAQQISDTNTVTDADIAAVLKSLQRVVAQHLRNGYSVRFGDLGSFRATIASKGEDSAEGVTAASIKSLRVRFTPAKWLKKQLSVSAGAVKFGKQGVVSGAGAANPEA